MISRWFSVDTKHANKSATLIADIRNVLKTKAHMGLVSSEGFIKLTVGEKASETSKHAAVLLEQSCIFLLLLCLQSWDSTIAFNGAPSKSARFYWHENRANRCHERCRFQVVSRVELGYLKVLINHSVWPLQRSKNWLSFVGHFYVPRSAKLQKITIIL